ncbi:hypothetical protein [Slackia piriformis]
MGSRKSECDRKDAARLDRQTTQQTDKDARYTIRCVVLPLRHAVVTS